MKAWLLIAVVFTPSLAIGGLMVRDGENPVIAGVMAWAASLITGVAIGGIYDLRTWWCER